MALAAPVLDPRASPGDRFHSMKPVISKVSNMVYKVSATDFNELHRAALLSSAAYSACQGPAFGVTITRQLNDVATDT